MKFGKIMQLWITGLIFLMSVSVYADDENILTISPSGDAGPGIYEITISGTRDSDTATVSEYTSDIRIMNTDLFGEGVGGGMPTVTVKAAILKGKNSGSSTYRQKFRILLDKPGVYYFSYLLIGEGVGDEYYKSGTVKMPTPPGGIFCHDGDNCNIFFVSERPSVNVSLQNVTAEITGTDSFTLRNLGAELGSGEKFNAWGNFRWNPDTLSFELKDAGLQ